MMVDDPLRWLDALAEAQIGSMTVHVESPAIAHSDPREHEKRLVDALRAIKHHSGAKIRAAIAVKPNTPVEPYLALLQTNEEARTLLDMVLVMTVEPGFGGQSFMRNCLVKVRRYSPLVLFDERVR